MCIRDSRQTGGRMELTPEELEALEPGSYTLLDLRSEQELSLIHI